MFVPVSSSLLTSLFGWMSGKQPKYVDAPNLIARAEGREVTRVKSGGIVKISFQVSQRNMDKYGYITKGK